MEIARSNARARELDMTPLIDIVFLLVIFFMLTTSFIASESIELSLPNRVSETPPPVASEAMRIRIESDGSLALDDTKLDDAALEQALQSRLGAEPETPIGIFTTPGVRVQELVRIMDMVYLSGGRKVKVDRIQFAPALEGEGQDGV